MKYSVIIPAYKCESTLENTVASIQKCGLTDFEIVLVDDGSPDGTPALCDRLAAEQENVRCFHQVNSGVSSARNRGLSEAKGEYVWFFDSDDLVDPESMTRAAQIIEEHAPDMLIFGMSFDFYKDGLRYARWDYSLDEEGIYSHGELEERFEPLFHKNAFTSSCNKLFSRELLIRNQISFCEDMYALEDFQFVLRALSKCKTVYLFSASIYRYLHFVSNDKKALDPSVERASHIEDIGAYMDYFEPYLLEHKKILVQIHYMLLRQKLRAQSIAQMKKTARQFQSSRFSAQQYLTFCTQPDLKLAKRLQQERCVEIYARRELSILKHFLLSRLKKIRRQKRR